MKYEKVKTITLESPFNNQGKIDREINKYIKKGWQPINISKGYSHRAARDLLFILMGKPKDE